MRGKWERKKPNWWQYRLAGSSRPFADVLQHREDGSSDSLWDALPTGRMIPLVEGVSLDEARAAVERHARQQADRE